MSRSSTPPAELNDIAMQARFAEYLAEPRVLAVAREMLDTHLRIAQTECNKSRAPTGEAFTEEQLRRRGWHSGNAAALSLWAFSKSEQESVPQIGLMT